MSKDNQSTCEISVIGTKYWSLNDQLHREDGPAYETTAIKEWWYHGEYLNCSSQEEFERLLKLKILW